MFDLRPGVAVLVFSAVACGAPASGTGAASPTPSEPPSAAMSEVHVAEAPGPTDARAEVEGPRAPTLEELEARVEAEPLDLTAQRDLFEELSRLGRFDDARSRLHAGLYLLRMAEKLPPESTWLPLVERYYDRETHAAEGIALLSTLDDFYIVSPSIDGLLVDYLVFEGRTAEAELMLESAVHEYPDDSAWSTRLDQLRATAPRGHATAR